MDPDDLSKTWHNYKKRASADGNDWDTEHGLNDQYAKSGSIDEHPDREQRSHSIDQTTDSQAQREPVNVLPGHNADILNPDSTYHQVSALDLGSDDMVSYSKISDPRNNVSTDNNLPLPPTATAKSTSKNSDISFFGDSNSVDYTPRSRTSLDQESLHRGYVSTLPSAYGKRRKNSVQQREVPVSVNNTVNKPRDGSVSTSAYDNVPIGSSALNQKDMKLSTGSSSDDYNNFLVDRNDMSKSNSYYRSTTENRHEIPSNSFDSDLGSNIPYSAKEGTSNFPSNPTEYAVKPKEKTNIATGESSRDKETLGQYAMNTHEKTDIPPGISYIKASDKNVDSLKGEQTDGSTTEDEDEATGGGFFSYATSAAAAVGAGAAAAGAVVSNAIFGKSKDNSIDTQRATPSNQHFSLDTCPSVWTSEDLASDHSQFYGAPIHWSQSASPHFTGDRNEVNQYSPNYENETCRLSDAQSTQRNLGHANDVLSSPSSALKASEKDIPHRPYDVPTREQAMLKDAILTPPLGPMKSVDNEYIPHRPYDVPTREQAMLKDAILTPPLRPMKSVENDNVPYHPHDVPTREQTILKDSILTPPLGRMRSVENDNVPYRPHDVPTQEQAILKDAILTPPPTESSEPELEENSPYNVPTRGQAILEKSINDAPSSPEGKKFSGVLPNHQLYTSMPLPDPLKLDQETSLPRPIKLESIEGDTREKPLPLITGSKLSDRMPGSFARSDSEQAIHDHILGIEHVSKDKEPAIHGQNACFHTMDAVSPEITPMHVSHSFCAHVKEPSMNGQNPSFYPNDHLNSPNTMNDKNLNQGNLNVGPIPDISSRPSNTLNQDTLPVSSVGGATPVKAITRELKSEKPLPENQGIAHELGNEKPLSENQDSTPKLDNEKSLPEKQDTTREFEDEKPLPENQGIAREFDNKKPLLNKQGISQDGVTYRDFASQGAYDPALTKANYNAPSNSDRNLDAPSPMQTDIFGNPLQQYERSKVPTSSIGPEEMSDSVPNPQYKDLNNNYKNTAAPSPMQTDIFGNPLQQYERSKVPTSSIGPEEMSDSVPNPQYKSSEPSKDNGYILGGQTPTDTNSPHTQSGYPSATSAAGAAAAVGASVGASKLFARGKKNQVSPVASEPYKIDPASQKLQPIPVSNNIPPIHIKKQDNIAGFNALEKESSESVSSTRATTGKIVPDANYFERNEDEIKPRTNYFEEVNDTVAKPITSKPALIEEEHLKKSTPIVTNAAKVPPATKDYPAKVCQTETTPSQPAENVRRKSKGSIVMDKLRRMSIGGRRSSSSNDYVIDSVADRRPSAAEIYKNEQMKEQTGKINTPLKINSDKYQTPDTGPLTITQPDTSGQSSKPIDITKEVPYYVEDPRLSSNGPQPQLDSNQKFAKLPGISNMRTAGTKAVKPDKTVFIRLNENHTTPQIRQVVVTQVEPTALVSNPDQDIAQNATTSANGTTGFVPEATVGTNDNVSFGTYISGHLQNRRGSIQKTVGKLVNNESMKEKGDLKKVSGKIKIKAYQDNRRSSSGSQ